LMIQWWCFNDDDSMMLTQRWWCNDDDSMIVFHWWWSFLLINCKPSNLGRVPYFQKKTWVHRDFIKTLNFLRPPIWVGRCSHEEVSSWISHDQKIAPRRQPCAMSRIYLCLGLQTFGVTAIKNGNGQSYMHDFATNTSIYRHSKYHVWLPKGIPDMIGGWEYDQWLICGSALCRVTWPLATLWGTCLSKTWNLWLNLRHP
jgi:hypothetical protein